jgi:two-component system sensor histidine kinase UhpB
MASVTVGKKGIDSVRGTDRGRGARYAVAILAAGLSLLARYALNPLLGDNTPYITLWVAIVFAAWFCGLGPSIAASLLGVIGVWYWIIPPIHSFQIAEPGAVISLFMFVFFSALIVAMGEAMRGAARKRMESEERYKQSIELASEAIFEADTEGHYTHVNEAACRLLGYSAEELTGLRVSDVVAAEELTRLQAVRHRLLAGENDISNWTLLRKDGSRVLTEVSTVILPGGRWQAFARDLTERRNTEWAMRESEERFRATFEQAAVGIAHVALDGSWLRVNQKLCEILGYSHDELLTKTYMEITHPDDLAADVAHAQGLLDGPEDTYHMDKRYIRKDGAAVWAQLTVRLLRGEDGTPKHFISVVQDIGARKQAEEQLRAVREQLEDRVRERTRELSQATQGLRDLSSRLLQSQDDERRRISRELHDSLGQMIAAVSMNLAFLQASLPGLSKEQSDNFQDTEALIQQISTEVRTLSHLLHPPLLDEVGLASALRWYVQGFGERSGIATDLVLDPSTDRMSREMEITIFRIVQECLTNVHRHSGSSTARVQVVREPGRVRVEVEDTGRGVSQTQLAVLNSSGAAGVGLRGMRERVHQLGGNIAVSCRERGMLVTAELPLADQYRAAV